MNTRIQKLIVFIFLLIGSTLLFTNCQTELNDEITDAKKAIVVKHITIKELQKKGNYAKILKNVSKAIKHNAQNNIEKGLFATDSTFYIHTDLIYETSTDSITNYTFRIERAALDSLKIENLIISKNNNTNDIQLRIIEFIKNENIYNTRLYAMETNNINLDALQNKSQEVYIYGQLIIVDGCVSVTYAPCDGRGTADGHDATSNCHGSATTLNFERCASITAEGGGGGGGTTGDGTTTNPDNTPINGGFPGGTHHPNTNIGSFAVIDKPDYYGSFLKSSNFSLGTAERNWLEAHPIEETVLKDFINENEASAQANAFGEAAVETWMEGGNVDFEEMQNIVNLSNNSPFNLDISNFFDNISPLPNDETPEAKKLECIYRKLTQSPKFKSLFVDTFEQSENVNIKFEIDDLPVQSNGQIPDGLTHANTLDVREQTIKLDRSNLLDNHPLQVAQTIIHEALHAFINVKQVECIETGQPVTYDDINALNQLTFDELLNDFYLDCIVNQPNQHRLMYNRMVNVMDEMLSEVFDDLVAPEDQNLNTNPQYIYDVPPNDGVHIFNWQDAFHYMNLNGLQQATEYNQDVLQTPSISFLVSKYTIYIKDPSRFNQNTCN